MNIRNNFLNINKDYSESNETKEEKQYRNNLLLKIKSIKNKLKENTDDIISLNKFELDIICRIYDIDSEEELGRELVKEIIHNTIFDTEADYPVVFLHNLLVINKEKTEFFLKKNDNTTDTLRELTQLLALIKLENHTPLKHIARIKNLSFDSNNEFLTILSLENKISEQLKHKLDFDDLINFLQPLENDFYFSDNGKKTYSQVFYDLSQLTIKDPISDNLVEFKEKKLCFNLFGLETYFKNSLNDDRKRELIQALILIVNKDKNLNNYSHTIFEQKQNIINFIEKRVSEEEIDNAISLLPNDKGTLTKETRNIISKLLKSNEKNKFLIFNDLSINYNNLDNFMTTDFKEDHIILYFIIQCYKEKQDIECTLINNKTIAFKEFYKVFYMENLLKKQLSKYTLSEILQTIHDFKKDKIFNNENELIIDNVISENFVKNFSFNTVNKEIIFINETRCVFNEKLMSKLNETSHEQILEMYLLTNNNLLINLGENISIDKRIDNLKVYQDKLIDKLKYQITEKDILNCIETIEKKSNTLIQSKDIIFKDTSISLNAKEVKEIPNDIVDFTLKNEEICLYSFNSIICNKLLQKELTDLSKREFIQSLFLFDIKNKKIVLKNKNENEIKIHENFNELEQYNDLILDKIEYKITEEEINKSLGIIITKINDNMIEDIQYIINNIKKQCGIKATYTFKNIKI